MPGFERKSKRRTKPILKGLPLLDTYSCARFLEPTPSASGPILLARGHDEALAPALRDDASALLVRRAVGDLLWMDKILAWMHPYEYWLMKRLPSAKRILSVAPQGCSGVKSHKNGATQVGWGPQPATRTMTLRPESVGAPLHSEGTPWVPCNRTRGFPAWWI